MSLRAFCPAQLVTPLLNGDSLDERDMEWNNKVTQVSGDGGKAGSKEKWTRAKWPKKM